MNAQVDSEALAAASRTAASIARGEITGCFFIKATATNHIYTGGDGDRWAGRAG